MLDRLVEILPKIKTKIQLTGFIVSVVGFVLAQLARPESSLTTQLALGSIGVLLVVFGQVFHFLKDFPNKARLPLVLFLFVLFLAYSLLMFWIALNVEPSPSREKAAILKLSNMNVELSDASFLDQVAIGNPKVVQLFLEAGFQPDQKTPASDNPLNVASSLDSPEILNLFVEDFWIDVESNGSTPLLVAIKNSRKENVELLLDRSANPNKTVGCRSPLRESMHDIELFQLLLDSGAKVSSHGNCEPLVTITAIQDDPEFLRSLIEAGADINAVDRSQRTALMIASSSNSLEILRLLIDQKAQLDLQDIYGDTALMKAVDSGSLDAVKILLLEGADPNILDHSGFSPLVVATQKNGRIKIMEELISYNANPNIQTETGFTALHFSIRNVSPHCIKAKLLLEAGANHMLANLNAELPLDSSSMIDDDPTCVAVQNMIN